MKITVSLIDRYCEGKRGSFLLSKAIVPQKYDWKDRLMFHRTFWHQIKRNGDLIKVVNLNHEINEFEEILQSKHISQYGKYMYYIKKEHKYPSFYVFQKNRNGNLAAFEVDTLIHRNNSPNDGNYFMQQNGFQIHAVKPKQGKNGLIDWSNTEPTFLEKLKTYNHD